MPDYWCAPTVQDLRLGSATFVTAEEHAMSDMLDARLAAFAYRRPSPEVQAIMTNLRGSYQVLACILDGEIPACREQSLAFTALEESAMWAMKALALTDPGGVVVDPPPTP